MASRVSGAKPATARLGVDLNKEAGSVMSQLAELGLDRSKPTLVVSEAVLFYLSPPAKRSLLAECAEHVRGCEASGLVLTDNLAPFVRGPTPQGAESFLGEIGLSLKQHDSLWGGAIQFVDAESSA